MIVDLERKLRPHEYPFEIYVQNCRTTKTTRLSFRQFFFSPSIENSLLKYPTIRDYFYRQVNHLKGRLPYSLSPSRPSINCINPAILLHQLMNSNALSTLKPSSILTIRSPFLLVHVILVKTMVMSLLPSISIVFVCMHVQTMED